MVSSTLKELAAERAAARGAITGLHLAPVMFELGARPPHPARELYRAISLKPKCPPGFTGARTHVGAGPLPGQ